MAQGKATKTKTNLPPNAKHKSNKTSKKNSAFNKRKSKRLYKLFRLHAGTLIKLNFYPT